MSAATETGRELLQLVTFFLGNEEYALDIALVQEIVRMTAITHVPRAPEFVDGVVNLRGRIVPVVDLRRRLGMPPAEVDRQTRIIIVQYRSSTVGLVVDRVNEVLRLGADSIEPAPGIVSDRVDTAYVTGVGKLDDRLLILLDLDRILAMDQVPAPNVAV